MRARLLLIVASVVLTLGLAEGALRRWSPAWIIPYPPRCYRPDLFERFDAHGYRLHPSRVLGLSYPPGAPRRVTVTSNADGFRDRRDFRDGDPRPRVVVLGDSMVFGMGVEEDERVTEALERLEPGWRVDNLGMVGFGPDLMLRALEAVRFEPAPRAAVVAIFSHDLYRVVPEAVGVGFPLPRYALIDGRLTTVPYPARPAWERLYLTQTVRYLRARYTGATFPLNAALLDRFRALAVERRIALGVVFVPGPRERADDRRRRAWLAGWARTHDTPFLDLTDAIADGGGAALYLPNDSHWNPDGHRASAARLRPFVAALLAAGG